MRRGGVAGVDGGGREALGRGDERPRSTGPRYAQRARQRRAVRAAEHHLCRLLDVSQSSPEAKDRTALEKTHPVRVDPGPQQSALAVAAHRRA